MTKIDLDKLTPMMKQYMDIKNNNKDAILFYRLGDFYEMFFDDAILVAKELEIALTARDCGGGQKAPMCGVPHHVADVYLNRLVENGHKVAIVEQMEDPRLAKGLVQRAITKIITPGTITDIDSNKKDNNFLLAIFSSNQSYGLSYIDITTGEFKCSEILNIRSSRQLLDFIVKVNPSEVLLNKNIEDKTFNSYIREKNIFLSIIDPDLSDVKKSIEALNETLGKKIDKNLEKHYYSIIASKMLIDYVYLFQNVQLKHINDLEYIETERFMKIDSGTRNNLEIHRNLSDGGTKFSLISVLDKTNTPMGSRKLNSWLEFPLIDKNEIEDRLDLIQDLIEDTLTFDQLKSYLNEIFDLERILSKISYQKANAKEIINLKHSISRLPSIKELLSLSRSTRLKSISKSIDSLEDIYQLIDRAILDNPPILITEGDLIKEGYSERLDKLKYDSVHGKEEMVEYEKELREESSIKNLRISYNKNIGYFIELTKSNIGQAPEYFIRRQTLKNSERYITTRLNEISDKILGSQADTKELEYSIFVAIREKIADQSLRIKATTDTIASLDAILSLARVAKANNYTRPSFNNRGIIKIEDGRHPVIEKSLDMNAFIPNNTSIGSTDNRIQIITGPNMAGKSTYMRQVALIILMAQIGSFVPASSCDLPISDAIFTRIGASDNLARGDSTFMIEMKEMSNIINNASPDSFVILDEVGRGTSTNDGLSIAVAIVEYMSKNLKANTLFATHYHELTQLAEKLENVKNYKVDILEENGNLIFLRKILPGSADKSYGIEVAKLSGLPSNIIDRAKQILKSMEGNNIDFVYEKANQVVINFNNLEKDLLLKEISDKNLDDMTAKEAYDYLYDLKTRAGDLIEN